MSFLAPAFLAGLGLLTIPWLIHKIRRPEREPLRFSSLMFVPDVKREVIERRRIQHLLLMLLRMLIFFLLVLAFSRLAIKSPVVPGTTSAAARHMILIDQSYSMGVKGVFDRATSEARDIVNALRPEDRVGVIAFSDRPALLAALNSDSAANAGEKSEALSALKGIELSHGATAYLPAMQLAQEQLIGGTTRSEDEPEMLVLHLITDFQKSGLPEKFTGWKLSPRIKFHPVDVGEEDIANRSVSDLSLRKTNDGRLRIVGKVKNWSPENEVRTGVRLVINGSEKMSTDLRIRPGNSTQAAFTLDDMNDKIFEGYLEIDGDTLKLDDRRYFAWRPASKHRVLLVADNQPTHRYPAGLFIAQAIPDRPDVPWTLDIVGQDELPQTLETAAAPYDLIIAGDLNGITKPAADSLLDYTTKGGALWLVLNETMAPEPLNTHLLGSMGLSSAGALHEDPSQFNFSLLSWIDFKHPIFVPFQGARFNDFSPIRFFNFHRLTVQRTPSEPIAYFDETADGSSYPAMLEQKLGEGRVVVWSFAPHLEWTNLPKDLKFVPIVFETLAHLTGLEAERRTWQVGDKYANLPEGFEDEPNWIVQFPETDSAPADVEAIRSGTKPSLDRAGLVRWMPESANSWSWIDPVNLDPEESNLRRISIPEFELKVTSDFGSAASGGEGFEAFEDLSVRHEFWQIFIAGLLLFLAFESWYAARLLR